MPEEGKKKSKATIDVVKKCPCCKEKLRIRHYRKKISPSVPAEYKVLTEIEPDKQKGLGFGEDEPPADDTKVTPAKSKKKTAKKGKTK